MTLEERFWSKVDKRGPDECWEWMGAKPGVHVRVYFGGSTNYAHRVAWVLSCGKIPAGKSVLHKCDNPPCCNPSHLFLGTQADNVRDMWNKGRGVPPNTSGEKNASAKLTWEKVRQIRKEFTARTKTIYALSKEHKVNKRTVSEVVRNITWRDENYTPIDTSWGKIMHNGKA